ncbi:MAG: DNA-deoxyinosine glycosylase [Rhodocyclaceae bacterium]|nr:DNA-deoxyinosine glycosylase [Rhodocyclaceae bacterium]MBX3669107.1 DNA-deoxyinosine glycosylase [Rhodocyclaceae bacterium]
MSRIVSFPPVENPGARLLVLGSMPGRASLLAGRYYAHPYNQFWPIMGELFGFDPAADYGLRLQHLRAAGIALWDVLQSCTRESSLDSDIVEASIVANDFAGFFQTHRHIRTICFNGGKAEQAFRRHVLRRENAETWFRAAGLACAAALVKLPSTSPAHASRNHVQKLMLWRTALAAGGLAIAQ